MIRPLFETMKKWLETIADSKLLMKRQVDRRGRRKRSREERRGKLQFSSERSSPSPFARLAEKDNLKCVPENSPAPAEARENMDPGGRGGPSKLKWKLINVYLTIIKIIRLRNSALNVRRSMSDRDEWRSLSSPTEKAPVCEGTQFGPGLVGCTSGGHQ